MERVRWPLAKDSKGHEMGRNEIAQPRAQMQEQGATIRAVMVERREELSDG